MINGTLLKRASVDVLILENELIFRMRQNWCKPIVFTCFEVSDHDSANTTYPLTISIFNSSLYYIKFDFQVNS